MNLISAILPGIELNAVLHIKPFLPLAHHSPLPQIEGGEEFVTFVTPRLSISLENDRFIINLSFDRLVFFARDNIAFSTHKKNEENWCSTI